MKQNHAEKSFGIAAILAIPEYRAVKAKDSLRL